MDTKPNATTSEWIDPDDAPELDDAFFERADVYQGETLIKRGRPPTGKAKHLISIRLAPDVLERLRGLGPGWQTMAAEALRAFVYPKPVRKPVRLTPAAPSVRKPAPATPKRQPVLTPKRKPALSVAKRAPVRTGLVPKPIAQTRPARRGRKAQAPTQESDP